MLGYKNQTSNSNKKIKIMSSIEHSSEKSSSKKIMTVALAGNPNCGKTTLFNAFTKLRQKVGNYPGVTVEKKMGRLVLSGDRIINVIDLPGTYSMSVRSPDERVARDVLLGRVKDTPRPDVVVCVVDASNIERNLYLFSQIQDLGVPVVLALNMIDELEAKGKKIDASLLSEKLGVPVVPMVASRQQGIDDLKKVLSDGFDYSYQRQWALPHEMEYAIQPLITILQKKYGFDEGMAFSEAILLLSSSNKEGDALRDEDETVIKMVDQVRECFEKKQLRWRSAVVESRYNWIRRCLNQTLSDQGAVSPNITEKIDAVLTHKVYGWMFFVGIMWAMFYLIFSVATTPMDWIDAGFGYLAELVDTLLSEGLLSDLIVNGIIAGVGGVVIFLPQILILFLFIGFLQDTGYMARAAFIMDRVMSKVGLHGKSFIPMLSSYACAIPGIMAARTIESPKDRLVTMLVAPLMSCSARIPVYVILIAVLMPESSAFAKTSMMMGMYALGTLGAALMAWVFKKTLLKGKRPVFIMELPPYRLPGFKAILFQMWERAQLFLKKAGTIILALSIVLWALMSFPKQENATPSEALKTSYAGQMGHAIEPVIKPLGYDWRIGVGLIASFAAREVFVSTMSIVFNQDEEAEEEVLQESFAQAHWPDGRPLFTPLVCMSLLVFYVFAMQCIATVGVMVRETNGWKWPLFQIAYMTLMAYFGAMAVYQIGRMLGFS